MDDAKTTPSDVANVSPPAPVVSMPVGVGGKEMDIGVLDMNPRELGPVQEIGGKEMELPGEVRVAGVRQQPTHVPIPPSVVSIGVQQVGPSVPLSTGRTITLPLSQTQVTQGLTQNIASSWRWLSEWCIRRLKQMRFLRGGIS